ncbi:MAG TPA: hypothetical protein VH969_21805 [Actinophytocola sp.]|jgi:hypothetical protein|uniref:hypothetical protein n=1 Tax=Actinophytocola sp. TaxID=1872138 RepID=UPI002F948C2A
MPEIFQMDRVDRITDILYGVATGRATITYRKLAFRVGARPDFLGHALEHVSRRAAERGEPMWSALVVSADTGVPGPGFYGMARRLDPRYRALTDTQIWEIERDRCYEVAVAARPA